MRTRAIGRAHDRHASLVITIRQMAEPLEGHSNTSIRQHMYLFSDGAGLARALGGAMAAHGAVFRTIENNVITKAHLSESIKLAPSAGATGNFFDAKLKGKKVQAAPSSRGLDRIVALHRRPCSLGRSQGF